MMSSSRLQNLQGHLLTPNPALFTGPIEDQKWDWDPKNVTLDVHEATRLY